MKLLFIFISFLILQLSIFALPNRIITGQIETITIGSYSSFTSNHSNENGETYSFNTNETDKTIKVYEISEKKGNYLIVSFVSL